MNWPSTTQILRHHGLYRHYEDWGNRDALKRGLRVNWACHLIASGRSLDPPEETAAGAWEARHAELHGYLEAYRKFFREHHFIVSEFEREYRNEELRFISHPDQLGILDKYGLVDLELKTGSMPLCCQLQTAGQVLAISPRKVAAVKRFALLLTAEGDYKLHPHDDWRDFDRFRGLVDAWWTAYDFGGLDDGTD